MGFRMVTCAPPDRRRSASRRLARLGRHLPLYPQKKAETILHGCGTLYAILSKRERLGGRGLWRCGGAAGDAPAYSPPDPRTAPLVRPASREEPTKLTIPTRRTLPRTALA